LGDKPNANANANGNAIIVFSIFHQFEEKLEIHLLQKNNFSQFK